MDSIHFKHLAKTMTSIVQFSGIVPLKRLSNRPTIGSSSSKTTCRFRHKRMRQTLQNSIDERKVHKLRPVMAYWRSNRHDSNPLSPSETVKEFYNCINDGSSKQLSQYISEDCYIDECSFPWPFRNKKEVLKFFEELIKGMGNKVRFKVNKICEGGDELIAAASWHLEWENAEIPYTRGCSFFEFRKEGDKLMIKNARIMIESPIKPGAFVLTLLKVVTQVFNNFPTVASWFLKSHSATLNLLARILNVPFIFVERYFKSYLQVWNLTTRLQGRAFKIVLYIIKLFFK